jgi:pantoate--beta-alanine ligase
MITARTVKQLRQAVAGERTAGKRIVFVPTMGNLHEGHLALVREARAYGESVVVSIYVNPLQFGPKEDFASYPRTVDMDLAALTKENADIVFLPTDDQVYPRGQERQTVVEAPGLGDILCGEFRPGHFRGVATVVNRLFNLVAPDVAVFGKKDYQQLLVIHWMVSDLGLPIEIIGIDTVREADGLAMSSRNHYLSKEQRMLAPRLYAVLQQVCQRIVGDDERWDELEAWAMGELENVGFKPQYISIRRQSDLAKPEKTDRALVVLAAALLGETRLIDNIEINRPR